MNNTLRNWLAAATGLLIICCLLAGCQEKEELIKCDSLPIMPDEPPFSRPEVSDVGVYLDVTLSMEGFLGMNSDSYRKVVPETVYMQCLDEVNELISGMFDAEDVTYYRVDTPTWKTEENVLEKAKLRGYYSDTRNQQFYYLAFPLKMGGFFNKNFYSSKLIWDVSFSTKKKLLQKKYEDAIKVEDITDVSEYGTMRIMKKFQIGQDEFTYDAVPKELADAVMHVIETVDFTPVPTVEKMIVNIVAEEAESYYAGDKSLEEVTRIIQNRARLLLQEQKK